MNGFLHTIIILILSALIFTGCEEEGTLSGSRKGVTLHIPCVSMSATRAHEDILPEEGKGSWVDVFIFDASASDDALPIQPLHIDLQETPANLATGDLTHTLAIRDGSYRLYALANYPLDPDKAASITQPELRRLVVEYSPEGDSGTMILGKIPDCGLPMACLPEDFSLTDTGTATAAGDGIITITEGVADIYCNLEYTVAKVQFTIVNGTGTEMSVDSFDLSRISSITPLFADSDFDYTDAPTLSLDGKAAGEYIYDDETTSGMPDTRGNWTWTRTVYLPERIVEQSAHNTLLSLSIKDLNGKDHAEGISPFTLGDNGADPADGSLPQNATRLRRGHLYDYRIHSGGKIALSVEPWSPSTVIADIKGSASYLIVDKTSLGNADNPVTGKNPATVYYDTDGEIFFSSDKKDATDYFTFKKGVDNSGRKYFTVSINPELPDNNTDIETDRGFYVIAGAIWKRINVVLKAEHFLTVTPDEYTIRIKDHRDASEAELLFDYATNYDRLTCEVAYTTDYETYATTAKYTSGYPATMKCEATPSPGKDASLAGMDDFGKSGEMHVRLLETYNTTLYNEKTVVRYRFTASMADASASETKEVFVKVLPYSSNYIVHFKPMTGNTWERPHVYAYTHLEKYNPQTGQLQTIMCNWDDTYQMYEAAIDICYTGGVTFKGWSNIPPIYEYPLENGSLYAHSLYFGWDISTPDSPANSDFYRTDIEYIAEHNQRVGLTHPGGEIGKSSCWACNHHSSTLKWPGIIMEKETGENAGYWKLTLPGDCPVGKTLLMFSNPDGGHANVNGQDSYNRYPLHLIPGMPLFDYEDREGWFVYNPAHGDNQEFYDTKEDAEAAAQ